MVQQHPVPSVFIKISEWSMAALQLMILIVITKIISSTNDSSFELPQEIQERIYSYFTPEQHYSIRRLNKEPESDPDVRRTFLAQLQHYTAFAQSLRRLNYTNHQMVMIEKLFCIIINNPKITSSNF
eukprot:703775_1